MRWIVSLALIAGIASGGWYAWENVPMVREFVLKKTGPLEFCTLEIRYSPEEIMRVHRDELLKVYLLWKLMHPSTAWYNT